MSMRKTEIWDAPTQKENTSENYDIVIYSGCETIRVASNELSEKMVIGNNVDNDLCVKGDYTTGEIVVDNKNRRIKVLHRNVYSSNKELLNINDEIDISVDMYIFLGKVQVVFKRARAVRLR